MSIPELTHFEADASHVAKLKQGLESWKQWRTEEPDVIPKLAGVNFTEIIRSFGGYAMGLDLSKADLSGASFRDLNLLFPQFDGAKLPEADFGKAGIVNASFRGCDLSLTTFSHATIRNSDFGTVEKRLMIVGADFSGSKLLDCRFSSILLNGVKFEGADLTNTTFAHSMLQACDCSRANFRGAKGMVFDDCLVREAHFAVHARDPWSVLRHNYTGPKFAFHLLLLIVFLLPKVIDVVKWNVVHDLQQGVRNEA